jgi:type I restriction enzyme S subunit
MNNWKQQKLGIVADVKLSNVDKLTNENERTIRLCNYTDVYKNSFISSEKSENFMIASCNENEYEKFILKKGQVAITKDSETPNDIGVSTYISEDFEDVVLGYHLALITPDKDKLNGRFLHYWLNTKQAKRYFENNAGGSGQRCTLVLDCIKSTPLYLPNLSIQEKIAKVLSDLDKKIELNKLINRELEAMAKTLYDYWFVQFDFPNEQGKPYKSSGGKMVYNAELKREIPEGWEVKKIGKVLSTKLGGTPLTEIKDYWINGDFHWLNSGEIANFPIITSELKITKKAIENSSTYLLPKGTIAISITRHIRPSILAVDSCANQSVIGILESEELKSSYLYPLIKNEIPRYLSLRTGAQQPHINKQTIDKTNIIIPANEILKKYYQASNQYYKKIINNAFQNQQLTELRDWLLPMLMNGQVTVKEAEEKLNMAAEPSVEYKKN